MATDGGKDSNDYGDGSAGGGLLLPWFGSWFACKVKRHDQCLLFLLRTSAILLPLKSRHNLRSDYRHQLTETSGPQCGYCSTESTAMMVSYNHTTSMESTDTDLNIRRATTPGSAERVAEWW
ncbi:hypothetical protein ACHAPO_006900 [Fusarium lateritium]